MVKADANSDAESCLVLQNRVFATFAHVLNARDNLAREHEGAILCQTCSQRDFAEPMHLDTGLLGVPRQF